MEQQAGSGAESTADDEFVTAQEANFEEPYDPEDDDERELDDGAQDDVTGIDEERRVDIGEETPADE